MKKVRIEASASKQPYFCVDSLEPESSRECLQDGVGSVCGLGSFVVLEFRKLLLRIL